MSRVLVSTSNPSWFVDASNPEGTKVRKRKDDEVFDNLIDAQQALSQRGNGNGASAQAAPASSKPAKNKGNGNGKAKESQETVVLSSGKVATGPTVTIRCQWKGPDDGDGQNGKRCTNERIIKIQDQFQVRYCEHHRDVQRKQKRSAAAKAKRAAAKAQGGSGSKTSAKAKAKAK